MATSGYRFESAKAEVDDETASQILSYCQYLDANPEYQIDREPVPNEQFDKLATQIYHLAKELERLAQYANKQTSVISRQNIALANQQAEVQQCQNQIHQLVTQVKQLETQIQDRAIQQTASETVSPQPNPPLIPAELQAFFV